MKTEPLVRPTTGQPFASKSIVSPPKSRLSVTCAPFHAFGTSPVTWTPTTAVTLRLALRHGGTPITPIFPDEVGSGAYAEDGVVPRAIRAIKARRPGMAVIADVCLCEYTSHGHCGLVEGGRILNDETLPLLARSAVCYAKAGADVVAPSDMMDGRVAAIRAALDAEGLKDVAIMSYSAKFASAYYGPFRDAAHSAPQFGDRRTYQMDPANGREALREVAADVREGADMIIAKPAIAYLDVLKSISGATDLPIVAYNVSGEYSMVKAAAANGWIDERRVVMENLIGMKRAGAKMIITYHALDAARWIAEEG